METPPQNETPPELPKKRLYHLDIMMVIVLAIVVALLVLRLHCGLIQAKTLACDIVCQSNMRTIGLTLVMYSEDREQYPPNWDILVNEDYLLEEDCFTCPCARPRNSQRNLLSNDYVFSIYFHPKELPESLLLLYELPINHNQRIVNLLWGDQHVDSCKNMDEFRKHIQNINDYIANGRKTQP